jgi:hypothetical protein
MQLTWVPSTALAGARDIDGRAVADADADTFALIVIIPADNVAGRGRSSRDTLRPTSYILAGIQVGLMESVGS